MRHEPAPQTSPSTKCSYGVKGIGILLYLLGSVPNAVSADDAIISENIAEVSGRINPSLPTFASNEGNVDGGILGMREDLGWYLSKLSVERAQQRLLYSTVKGDRYKEESGNSAMRGYDDSRFDEFAVFPIAGADPGRISGGGISGESFALSSKFHIGHSEYQWFFRKSHSTHKHLDRGPGGYMVGLGYNF